MNLLMSQRERDYAKVLEQLEQGQMTRLQAAEVLGLCPKQVSRLRRRYREQGDAGLVHRLRGQPSNRRLDPAQIDQAMELIRERYADFGPTLAAEQLAHEHGLHLSHETLRQAMIREKLWQPTPRKGGHRQWRERKPCWGQLVQMDSSEHDWFEGRGETAELIAMIDDATSLAYLCFVPADNSEANMMVLRDYMRQWGRPLALYTDKASHFVVNRPASVDEQLEGLEAETQIGRALRELQVELIVAHSPQAKGRVERLFGTAQDRLVKLMRLRGISTIAAANEYLQTEYMPWWNGEHTMAPTGPADAHRGLESFDLDAIFSHQEPRQVQNDYTISYCTERYQILPPSQLPNLRKSRVTVQQRLDGTVAIFAKGQYLQATLLPSAGGAAAAPAVGLRPPCGAAATATPVAQCKKGSVGKGHKPAPDHPWCNPNTRTFLSGGKRGIPTLR